MFHAFKAPASTKILVKASDTDVLIILLVNIHKVSESEIWLAGLKTPQNNREVNHVICTKLASKSGSTLCLNQYYVYKKEHAHPFSLDNYF